MVSKWTMTVELLKSIINRNIKQLEIEWRTYKEESNIWQTVGGIDLISKIDHEIDLLNDILNEYETLANNKNNNGIQILHKTNN